MRIYDSIQKVVTDQGDNYATGCLLDYYYFNKHYKMIVIDISQQEPFDADQKQYNKLILLEIWNEMKVQLCFSLLKKHLDF